MTALPDFGPDIDTIERRLVVSAFLLRSAICEALDPELTEDITEVSTIPKLSLEKAIQISTKSVKTEDGLVSILLISLDFFYDKALYMKSCGDLFNSVIPYTNLETSIDFELIPSELESLEDIPEISPDIEDLEHLFLSDCEILAASTFPDVSFVAFNVLENKPANITLSLPFDYAKYRLTRSYPQSLFKVFDYHVFELDQLTGNLFTVLPSPQFWGNPLADIDALKVLEGLPPGVTRWIIAKQSFYVVVSALPAGTVADDDLWVHSAGLIWKKNVSAGLVDATPPPLTVTTLADTDLIHISQEAESGTDILFSDFKDLLSGNESTVATLANSDKFQVIIKGVKSLLTFASLQTLLGGNSSSSVSKGIFSEYYPSGVEYPIALFKRRVSSDIKITAITITFMPTINDVTRVVFNGKSVFVNFFTAPNHTVTILSETMFIGDGYGNEPGPFSTVFTISPDPSIHSNPYSESGGIELGIGSLNNIDYEAYISMSYEFV